MFEGLMKGKTGQAAIESAAPTARHLHGQAAMEYLMTYGWALLVIVIVIAILISLNIFSPPQGCTFENPGFGCVNPAVDTNGQLFMMLTNGNPNNIRLLGIACTADKQNAPSAPEPGDDGYFGDAGGNGKLINRQVQFDITSGETPVETHCYKDAARTIVFDSENGGPAGTEFSGKIWVFYQNEEDGENYPVRTSVANVNTRTLAANP